MNESTGLWDFPSLSKHQPETQYSEKLRLATLARPTPYSSDISILDGFIVHVNGGPWRFGPGNMEYTCHTCSAELPNEPEECDVLPHRKLTNLYTLDGVVKIQVGLFDIRINLNLCV